MGSTFIEKLGIVRPPVNWTWRAYGYPLRCSKSADTRICNGNTYTPETFALDSHSWSDVLISALGFIGPLSTFPLNSRLADVCWPVRVLDMIGTSRFVAEYEASSCQVFDRRLKRAMSTLENSWSAFGSFIPANCSNAR